MNEKANSIISVSLCQE